MRNYLVLAVVLVASLASPAFAYMNITSNYVNLSSQSNLGSNATMLNLTFNLTDATTVNITKINFTFSSTTAGLLASQTNLSVCVYNTTIAQAKLLGCNASWIGSITTVPVNYNVSNSQSANLLAVYEIFFNASNPMNISLGIASNSSILLDNASIFINNTFPITSNYTEVRVVNASASISPPYVDTNVTNQTLRYFVYSMTGDAFKKINISIPPGFSLVDVVNYTIIRTDDTSTNTSGCSGVCSIIGSTIAIGDVAGMKNITVYFNVNTNASEINSIAFNSTINGTNLDNIPTYVFSSATNVTTKNLVNITNTAIIKNAAIVNGTDYWEFNFTINTSATVSGMVQFRMSSWNSSSSGAILGLVNTSGSTITNYATLRENTDNFSTSNKINISTEYNTMQGVLLNATAGTPYNIILRMIIPAGTPIASDWWATYGILFRAQP